MSNSSYFVVSREQHGDLVQAAYMHRGYREDESASAARMCFEASWHGIRTHNARKALHLDELCSSKFVTETPIFASNFQMARSRLFRRQILRPNTSWKTLDEI